MNVKKILTYLFATLCLTFALSTTAYCSGVTCGGATVSSASVGNIYSSGTVFTLSSTYTDYYIVVGYYAYNSDGEMEYIGKTYNRKTNYYSEMGVTKNVTLKDQTYDGVTYSKWKLYSYKVGTESIYINYSYTSPKKTTVYKYYIYVVGVNPVTDISGVPETAYACQNLTLTGTISPDGIDKDITWSVKDAGTTGAVIKDNVLKSVYAGKVVVTATVEDGICEGTDYTQDFTIKLLLGDVDENGTVDDADAAVMLKYLSGLISSRVINAYYNMDQMYINDDNVIDMVDVVELFEIKEMLSD